MNEWNAIDLHMHTVKGITRDKKTDNVKFNYTLFGEAIKKHKLKLMACTNHNIIDITNYILMRYLAKIYKCNLLMGVELDSTMSTGKPIHIAAIFENDFFKNYSAGKHINEMTEIKKNSLEDLIINYSDDDIISILKNYNCLLIPHGDKDRGMLHDPTREELEEALQKVKEGFIRIFDSSSNWKFTEIKSFLHEIDESDLDKFGGVLFSDNRDWTQYDAKFKNFKMNAEPTFNGLIHSISNPTKRFSKSDEILQNNNYIKKIEISDKNKSSKIKPCTLNLSSGYNCVIGKSGSGKSLLLYLIKKYLKKGANLNNSYSFSENSNIVFYNEENKIIDSDCINIGVGESLYNKIISAVSSKDTNDYYKVAKALNPEFIPKKKFERFKNTLIENIKLYCINKENYNKELEEFKINLNILNDNIKKKIILNQIKIFNLNNLRNSTPKTYSDAQILEFSKYKDNIDELKNKANIYKGQKKIDLITQIAKLEYLFKFASVDMIALSNNENVINQKFKVINNSINFINGTKSEQAKEKSDLIIKSIPESRNKVVEQILNLYVLKRKIDNMDLSINKDDYNSVEVINSSEKVLVKELIASNIFTKLNEKENFVFKTHGFKQYLDIGKTYDLTNKKDAKKLIDKYILTGVFSKNHINFVDDFDVEVSIFFDNQNVKELNPGSIAKKYIDIYFSQQVYSGKYNVVLFDQIENDVDKEFINIVIKEKIEKTKGKVQLIVVTHDPIVAVNADPNNYIISTKLNDKIEYRNFVAESSTTNELKTIANTVDGSKEVIKGRYEIYEGDRNYEN